MPDAQPMAAAPDAEPADLPDPLPAGALAARIAEADGDLIVVTAEERRAEQVAALVRAAATAVQVAWLPASDALPGDAMPPSPANAGRRVAALHCLRGWLAQEKRGRVVLVASAEAAVRLVPAPAAYDDAPPHLAPGDAIDVDAFAAQLQAIGYVADDRVDEPGEMAVRGQVIDVFPADAAQPVRIEHAEGKVTDLRAYDPVSQRGTDTLERLALGRACEPPLGKDAAPLFTHLPDAAVLLDPAAEAQRDRFIALAVDSGAGRGMVTAEGWADALAGRAPTTLDDAGVAAGHRYVEKRAPLKAFAADAEAVRKAGGRVVLAGSERDLRFLARRIAKAVGDEPQAVADWGLVAKAKAGSLLRLVWPLDRGWRDEGTMVVAAADLIGSRAVTDAGGPATIDPLRGAPTALRIGDVVVHEDFGIGVVAGLESLPNGAGDAIVLEYAGEDRRLVPVDEADRIWRYGADRDAVTLDKLDGTSWQKRRGAIDQAVAESARQLTRLAEERARRAAPPLKPPRAKYERFAAGFPFTETTDQSRAIAAVLDDLAAGRPMDRLVVGDVGYGKTEVALRAAAAAALAGHQVVVAAPTTVLVRQHLETFRARFAGTGIEVAGLSRLSTPAEKRAVKAGLKDGSIGVVVGTGAVAGKGVDYARLGLVVIDEEQRFGTRDKDKLRGLADAHVLSLSATPIPRTLQSALVGLQQVSVIATPPARRQPIRTAAGPFDPATVRTALRREKARGGQSFMVVPRIEDMAGMAERLAQLVPELAVLQAHGKMPAAEIDEAMVRFAGGDGDVLLATNIIEAGLDVPRANTMVVWRADRFGLSQLHQLRGRVGRGGRRGQVLLTTEPDASIAEATLKRLRTLQAFDRLGAGFEISARDLDLRGAGDLVGEAQAGHMKLIGVDLYQFLLEAALRAARGEPVERWAPELNLEVIGSLPEGYIPDAEVRLGLYARLARLGSEGELEAFADELEDRFGPPPPEAETLVAVARVRRLAAEAGIARIDAGPAAIALTPRRDFAGDAGAAGLEERNGRLILAERIEEAGARLARVEALLAALAG